MTLFNLSARTIGAGPVVGRDSRDGSGAIRSTRTSKRSLSTRSRERERFLKGSRGVLVEIGRGGAVSFAYCSLNSASEGPRKACVKDLSGMRKPDRLGFPAAGVAGTLGLGF